jgi:hypothetical protein
MVSSGPAPNELFSYYDERFMAGKNKIQHVAHLRVHGYQFAILPEGFIVHYPHRESKAKKAGRMSRDRNCMPQWTSCIPNQGLFIKYEIPSIIWSACVRMTDDW